MTTAITTVDCGGAQIRAHCRHLATVVTIRGEIDADNVESVGQHLHRFTLGNSPVVLDMSEVVHSGAVGFSLLSAFDEDCHEAGVEWTVVPSPAAPELLGDMFPVTGSVRAALHDLADAIDSRRQLVLPLIKKTA